MPLLLTVLTTEDVLAYVNRDLSEAEHETIRRASADDAELANAVRGRAVMRI